jgi:alpha-beta hydrolase superfamily lysophospholipase
MNNTTYKWQSFDHETLFGQSWLPLTEPKAVINFVHGIGEHSSRYHDWMPFFCDAGYAVYAIEYRGHGQSFGKRGYTESYEHILKDIDVLFEESRKAYPKLPQFLYGHSLGGNIVSSYAISRKPEILGLIATSPWYHLSKEPPSWQISLVRFFHQFIPGFTIKSSLKAKDISQSVDLVKKYKADPYVHKKISFELLVSAFDKGKWLVENSDKIRIPMFLTHGEKDMVTAAWASEAFAKNNPEKVTFKLWNGMMHELHNEPVREEFAQMLTAWLDERVEESKDWTDGISNHLW